MIQSKLSLTVLLFGLLGVFNAAALTIVECVDSEGNTSFRDSCPPEMTKKSQKELRGEPEPEVPPSAAEIAENHPVTLFVAPNCNACDLVRNMLETRNIPFAEKDASEDPQIQAELSAVTEGALVVPTLTIGEEIKLTDYDKGKLESALSSVGFP